MAPVDWRASASAPGVFLLTVRRSGHSRSEIRRARSRTIRLVTNMGSAAISANEALHSKKHVMARAVWVNKDQKIAAVVSSLQQGYSDDFIRKLQVLYPLDWRNIVRRYQQHLRDHIPGKTIPMPEPNKYLSNALRVWKAKQLV